MSDYEYERREAQEFQRQLREPDRDSLQERRESCAEFLDAMKNRPDVVAERVDWLLAGNYGYGAMKAAREVVSRTRMNREAWLVHTVAAVEWKCPQRMAIASWKKLSPAEKAALSREVGAEIRKKRNGD